MMVNKEMVSQSMSSKVSTAVVRVSGGTWQRQNTEFAGVAVISSSEDSHGEPDVRVAVGKTSEVSRDASQLFKSASRLELL
jgi:N6-adenosine-specific RNA methylase IME4